MAGEEWRTAQVGLVLCLSLIFFTAVHSLTGRSFLVVFPNSLRADPYIFLTTDEDTSTRVVVTSQTNITVHLMGGDQPVTKEILLPGDLLMMESLKYHNSCVRVEADDSIVVHALTMAKNAKGTSSVAYLVLPVTELSTYYLTLTYCRKQYCVLVAASPYNDTRVNVTLATDDVDASITYNGRVYAGGDVIYESLQEYESMQVLAKEIDMSGSTVVSNKPIAVVSGSSFVNIEDTGRSDGMFEMMPPVETLGTEYAISGYPNPSNGTWVFVVLLDPVTTLTYNSTVLKLEESTPTRFTFFMVDVTTVSLASSQPVLVAICPAPRIKTFYFDPSLVLVMPIEFWSTRYVVSSLLDKVAKSKYKSSLLVILMKKDCHENISSSFPDYDETIHVTITGLYVTHYVTFTTNVTFSLHTSNCSFGGFLTQSGRSNTIGVPLGWAALPLTFNESLTVTSFPPTSSTVSDDVYTDISTSWNSLHTSHSSHWTTSQYADLSSTEPVTDFLSPSNLSPSSRWQETTSLPRDTPTTSFGHESMSTPVSSSTMDNEWTPTLALSTLQTGTEMPVSPNSLWSGHTQTILSSPGLASPTTTAPKQTTNKPVKSNPTELVLCPCKCNPKSVNISSTFPTKEEEKKMRQAINKELAVNVSSLSSTTRRKMSMMDMRPTYTVIGSAVAAGVMTLVTCLIVVPDVIQATIYLYKLSRQCL